jgi:hypothetical protein
MLRRVRRLRAVGRDCADLLALLRVGFLDIMEMYLTYAFAEMGEEVQRDGTGKVDTK